MIKNNNYLISEATYCTYGAKITDFHGYIMPASFEGGIIEHKYIREGGAGLFDVSHMGQILVMGKGADDYFNQFIPWDIHSIPEGSCKYTLFLNEKGGIIDDIILWRYAKDHFILISNASRKELVLQLLHENSPQDCHISLLRRGLLALQGKKAVDILKKDFPFLEKMPFMTFQELSIGELSLTISRSGYTGEDGFEISVDYYHLERIYHDLLSLEAVKPCGLAARDTLRLEAGLCLYGSDLTESTTPIEAGLGWCVDKKKLGNIAFRGDHILKKEIKNPPLHKRVGIIPAGRAPIRAGTKIVNEENQEIGYITSGSFSPMRNCPISMGYVQRNNINDTLFSVLRGKKIPLQITRLPFIPHQYYK